MQILLTAVEYKFDILALPIPVQLWLVAHLLSPVHYAFCCRYNVP